ncbi:hypothetical protein HDU85_007689 [Gaertneriomyces sp. JEL0708]|nr:hypothetical protein HDU85_007689 [Gaertneriomyces sp. JEL0708]
MTDGVIRDPARGFVEAAKFCFKNNDLEGAIEAASEGLREDAKNAKLLSIRVLSHLSMGSWVNAYNDAARFAILWPTDAKAYLWAALARRGQRKWEEARKIYQIAKRKVPPKDPKYKEVIRYEELFSDTVMFDRIIHGMMNHELIPNPTYIPPPKSSPSSISTSASSADSYEHRTRRPRVINFSQSRLFSLPREIMVLILNRLSTKDKCRLLRLSASWRNYMSGMPELWTVIDTVGVGEDLSPQALQRLIKLGNGGIQVLRLGECEDVTPTALRTLITTQRGSREDHNGKYVRICPLKVFDLQSNTKIDGKMLPAIFECVGRGLNHLNLRGTSLTNECLGRILDICRSLLHLDVSHCKGVTDEGFRICDAYKRKGLSMALRHVLLMGTVCGDAAVELLTSACPDLETVDLNSCAKITPNSVKFLAKASNLRVLVLTGTKMVNGAGSITLHDGLQDFAAINGANLERFELHGCPQLTTAALGLLIQKCRNLRHLDLAGCVYVADENIAALSSSCPQLEVLKLSRCARLTDKAFLNTLPELKNLRVLDIADSYISDQTITVICKNVPCLSELSLAGCERITSVGVRGLAKKKGTPLKFLCLNNCENIHMDCIMWIKEKVRGIVIKAYLQAGRL